MRKCPILILFLIGTAVPAWCQTTFTPTTVGWYRVINSIGVSSVGGILRMYAPYTDGTFTDNEIQFNETGYGAGGSIQQTRFSSFGGSMVSQARLSGDGAANIYLDIYVSTVGGPLTLYFDGPNINGVVNSPVVGATAGSYTLPTLTLSQGLSTTSNLNAIGTLNVSGSGNSSILGNLGIGTISPGAALEVNGNVKLTSGSGASITFADGTVQSSAPPASLTSSNGNVGIGTTNPFGVLHIQGSTGQSSWVYDTGNANGTNPLTYFGTGIAFGWNQTGGGGESDLVFGTNAGSNPGLQISEWDGTTYQTDLFVKKGGNVGIGTSLPGAKLEVVGTIQLDGASGKIQFPDGSQLISANGQSGSLSSLNVQGTNTGFIVSGTNLDPNFGYSLTPLENSGKLLLGWNMSGGNGEEDFIENRGDGGSGGFRFYDYSNTGVLTPLMTMTGTGSLGLGVTNPGTDLNQQTGPVLEVVGNIAFKQGAPGVGTGAGIIFSDGTSQTTAYQGTSCPIADVVMPDKTIVAQGGDYAEAVDVNGDRATYEPGDVMVISDSVSSDVTRSEEPYSTRVAGIYSTKPGYVGRRQTSNPKLAKSEIPMAMIGIVPTKVTADNGPVHRGDLLVTSSQRGYAMKGTDRLRMVGSVVGKAMGTLESGSGLIEVLVTLQ